MARGARPRDGGSAVRGRDPLGRRGGLRSDRRGRAACLIDGLGHGPDAADAAEICGDAIRAHAEASPQELLEACHEALLDTRGVVMTAAWFDLERETVVWAGVGNVDARLVHAGPELREEVALVFGGVLGYRMPRIRPATMPLERGDLLVMITDGIDGAISPALTGGGAAQTLADRIFEQHGKGTRRRARRRRQIPLM